MDWLLLALGSAFSLATADALTKRGLAGYSSAELVVVRFGAAGLLLLPWLLYQPWPDPAAAFWGWVAALVPLEVLAMVMYMAAIRGSDLARTVPYLAFTPAFVTVTGWLVLGERVTGTGLAGVLLVTAGAWILNIEHVRWREPSTLWRPLGAIVTDRGSRLMLGTAAVYSLTSVMGKAALGYVPARFFGAFYYVLLGAITLTGLMLWRPDAFRALTRRPAWQIGVGVAMAAMVVTHFLAVERVEVAYMIAVKRTSLLFGILYGAWLFGEARVGQHLSGGILMVAGVFFVATG